MAELTPIPPAPMESPAGASAPRTGEPESQPGQPARYDANLRLIHRRLADEKRMAKPKPWWKPGP